MVSGSSNKVIIRLTSYEFKENFVSTDIDVVLYMYKHLLHQTHLLTKPPPLNANKERYLKKIGGIETWMESLLISSTRNFFDLFEVHTFSFVRCLHTPSAMIES